MKILTSGESHGDSLYAIIDGFPSGFKIDVDMINNNLAKRMESVGRGPRSSKETDHVKFLTGVTSEYITTGSPITMQIKNDLKDLHSEEFVPRPGHADLAGSVKFNHKNVRYVLERASARKTAMDVAIGALCKQILEKLSISTRTYVKSIYGKPYTNELLTDLVNEHATDTFGGTVVIEVEGLPIGIGTFVNGIDKLDAILAKAIMSTNSVKGVSFGLGFESELLTGYEYVDRIEFKNNKISTKTNNSGGIDGGMSNGNKIIINAAIKPIPTQFKDVDSINLLTLKKATTFKERGDNFVVEPISLILEMNVATEILKILLDKFDSDNMSLLKMSYENYNKYVKEFFNETT